MKYLKTYEDTVKQRRGRTKIRFIKALKQMTTEECVDFVLKNCQEFIKNPITITRGVGHYGDANSNINFYSKPVKRFSRDNKNEYTLLMDNLPSWKDYPKRRKSFICTLGETSMNNIKYVIPVDGSIWGISPEFDIYHCFQKTLKSNKQTDITIDDFFKLIHQVLTRKNSDTNFRNFRKTIIDHDKKLWKIIIDIMDPIKNDFKLLSVPEIFKNLDSIKTEGMSRNDKEVWTESPCIFIDKESKDEFYTLLNEKLPDNLKILIDSKYKPISQKILSLDTI